jgi:hypothetical protein
VKHQKLAIAAAGFIGIAAITLTIGAVAEAHHHDQPTDAEVAVAAGTSDLMVNTVVAALVQEIGETTPANAAQGSVSISLVFNDANHDMRLVGTLDPLHDNDRPEDAFEQSALAKAMTGTAATSVERVRGQWYYRRSVPLSNFAPQCQMCHSNFAALSSSDWVGALMLRVPIDTH